MGFRERRSEWLLAQGDFTPKKQWQAEIIKAQAPH